MPRIVLAALASLALACSGAEPRTRAAEESAERPAPQTDEAPLEPVSDAPGDPDPGSTCGRALACCRAYASAMPDVLEASACAGIFDALEGPQPDRRCRGMATGWRRALEHLRGEAPEPCR